MASPSQSPEGSSRLDEGASPGAQPPGAASLPTMTTSTTTATTTTMAQGGPPNPNSVNSAGKARKIAPLACQVCRRRRVRCVVEGDNTACKVCIAGRLECVFTGVDKRKESIKEYRERLQELEGLFEKIRTCPTDQLPDLLANIRGQSTEELEAVLAGKERPHHQTLQDLKFRETGPIRAGIRRRRDPDDVAGLRMPGSAESSSPRSGYYHDSPNEGGSTLLDLAEIADRLVIDDEGQIRAFEHLPTMASAASGGLAAREITNEKLKKLPLSHPTLQPAPQAGPFLPTCPQSFLQAAANNIAYLPLGTDIRTVEHLLTAFFMWFYPVFPLVSKQIFLDHMYNGGKYCTPLLLNAVLSVASHLSDWPILRTDPADPATTGEAFFNMAKTFLDKELEKPSITTVQALALMAKSQAFSGRSQRGALYLAMSGRIVFDLGLHLDASFLLQKGVVTEEDLYVRSRAFWGVWVFDKEFSALVGRPSTLRDVQITCPKPDYWELDDFDFWASCHSGHLVPLTPETRGNGTLYVGNHMYDMSGVYFEGKAGIFWKNKPSSFKESMKILNTTMADVKSAMDALGPIRPRIEENLPGVIAVRMCLNCYIMMVNRPFITEKAFQTGIMPEHSPRERCWTAAVEVVQHWMILRTEKTMGLRSTLNAQQYTVVESALIFIFEATTHFRYPGAIQRQQLAKEYLDQLLDGLAEMSEYRPAANQALTNLRSIYVKRLTALNNNPVNASLPLHNSIQQQPGAQPSETNTLSTSRSSPSTADQVEPISPQSLKTGDFPATYIPYTDPGYPGMGTIDICGNVNDSNNSASLADLFGSSTYTASAMSWPTIPNMPVSANGIQQGDPNPASVYDFLFGHEETMNAEDPLEYSAALSFLEQLL